MLDMARSYLQTPELPNLEGIAVIGSTTVSSAGQEMARRPAKLQISLWGVGFPLATTRSRGGS
jgi:hypothetical protein